VSNGAPHAGRRSPPSLPHPPDATATAVGSAWPPAHADAVGQVAAGGSDGRLRGASNDPWTPHRQPLDEGGLGLRGG